MVPAPESPAAGPILGGARLRSWQEIAAYAGVSVATVQRWERDESLPVHRHLHRKLATVYAFPGEIDAWLKALDTVQAGDETCGEG